MVGCKKDELAKVCSSKETERIDAHLGVLHDPFV